MRKINKLSEFVQANLSLSLFKYVLLDPPCVPPGHGNILNHKFAILILFSQFSQKYKPFHRVKIPRSCNCCDLIFILFILFRKLYEIINKLNF